MSATFVPVEPASICDKSSAVPNASDVRRAREASGDTTRLAHAPRLPGVDRASSVGSVLLGTLAASMVAGRFETAAIVIGVAWYGAWAAGAKGPRSAWFVALAWGAGLAIALNLYLVSGTPLGLPRLFGAPATGAGLRAGALLGARLIGAAIALHGLGAAWPGERAADELAARLAGFEYLGVPVRSVRAIVALALRFAPLIASEHQRIARLQELRAGGPPRTLAERLERFRAIVIPSVVGAIETAERVSLGLEARHYRLRAVPAVRDGIAARLAGWIVFGITALWRA
jgi:energy-coupling factor transporter transmembrane protein EcfT